MTKKKRNWRELSPLQKAVLVVAGIVEVLLLLAALFDLRRRPAEQIRGNKRIWTLVAFFNYVGPIAYFLVGRKRVA
ncbi:MAG: PLDc N-terminal domain-containing protein [Anaerolineae bacterium]|nr:PLDc N-terminal domain-containing protein [Anaerolineae bacterium]MCB9129621.1 PLDc N-terminal domain-containing protein [Anaerolineales bacterium]MCB0229226.1 PLDc N-terminal domain-containing protein [Anaerolineae bacterium]MCB0238432.1 PLDc N-terminal domain-containing protein [Anaerolineae bacterium]MCB0242422.1 PLDc N-terminal domain-containing protein [Anaerolineae bacterium]